MNDMIKDILPNLSGDDQYINAITKRYLDFIKYTQLPEAFINNRINIKSLPSKLSKLYDNTYTIINDRFNLIFNLADNSLSIPLASMIINHYFQSAIEDDLNLDTILYIDTNLLMKDYKRLIDKNETCSNQATIHTLDTLYRNIETASFIIWDRFTMINSNYEKSKLYDILSIRYRRGLGNIFFITGGISKLSEIIDKETIAVMNIDSVIDCSKETVSYLDSEKGNIKW